MRLNNTFKEQTDSIVAMFGIKNVIFMCHENNFATNVYTYICMCNQINEIFRYV